ncbi:hypothetical protein [Paraburkholderia fungorum]|jgi:hypothetical protein|uniref:hypothetical protein n=1 Tax=Paraburkholderia fungorum TaxID=134537 RepID=UPI00142E81E9|nr:hypothetical protein [Paraburkholderia fungorum]
MNKGRSSQDFRMEIGLAHARMVSRTPSAEPDAQRDAASLRRVRFLCIAFARLAHLFAL